MKLGIIQGRLLKPVGGHIQEFPKDWKREFTLLRRLGLSHVEWIVTASSFLTNPVFFEDCSEYEISSICADNLVHPDFNKEDFLRDNLLPLCEAALKSNIHWLTIPLLEKSSISERQIRNKFIDLILEYADKYPQINFSFEAETHWDNVLEIASLRDNFWITYDTGNITSEGIDHQKYILNTHHKISNVHIKDRTFEGKTVKPLTGNTDFETIFNTLRKVKYNNLYTLQTARGEPGSEVETITKHKEIFERMIYHETDD